MEFFKHRGDFGLHAVRVKVFRTFMTCHALFHLGRVGMVALISHVAVNAGGHIHVEIIQQGFAVDALGVGIIDVEVALPAGPGDGGGRGGEGFGGMCAVAVGADGVVFIALGKELGVLALAVLIQLLCVARAAGLDRAMVRSRASWKSCSGCGKPVMSVWHWTQA